ncbi:MAG: hypothetical protein IKD06_01385 [Clostridia bacterium]|nr:hypothetical protein [Clostridia bacterium]
MNEPLHKLKQEAGLLPAKASRPNRHWGMKILSVLFALILWVYVTSVEEGKGTTERTFSDVNIDIRVDNAALEAYGLTIISGLSQTAEISVTGNRAQVMKLTRADISVYAELKTELLRSGNITLPVQVSLPNGITLVDHEPALVTLQMENMATLEIPVRVDTSNQTVPDGYAIESPIVYPTNVSVSGPSYLLSQIKEAVVEMPAGSVTSTITTAKKVRLVDENGVEVQGANLAAFDDTVSVTIPVLKVVELPLCVSLLNAEREGDAVKVSLDPGTIKVAAQPDLLSGVTEISVGTLDLATIDLQTAGSTSTYTFFVKLPSTWKNLNYVQNVKAEVAFDGLSDKTVRVDQFVVMPEISGKAIEVQTRAVDVHLRGETMGMLQLGNGENISLVIQPNALSSQAQDGVYEVKAEVLIDLPYRIWAIGTHTLTVKVSSLE